MFCIFPFLFGLCCVSNKTQTDLSAQPNQHYGIGFFRPSTPTWSCSLERKIFCLLHQAKRFYLVTSCMKHQFCLFLIFSWDYIIHIFIYRIFSSIFFLLFEGNGSFIQPQRFSPLVPYDFFQFILISIGYRLIDKTQDKRGFGQRILGKASGQAGETAA